MNGELKTALKERLDKNYDDFLAQLQEKTVSELVVMAPEIVAAQQCHEELLDACDDGDIQFLLQFDDPLELVRGYWEAEITAAQQCHEELLDACDDDDVTFLLQFDDPLEVVRGYWESEITGYDHSGEMGHMLWEIRDREMYDRDLLAQPPRDEGDSSPAVQGKKSKKKERNSHER